MMRGWLRDHNILKQDRVVVVPMRGKGASLNLTVPEVRAKWAAQLKAWGASVLILDCLRPVLDSLGLNENTDAGRFLNAGFDPLLADCGLQGMVIHHMGHSNERARGDSSMLGWGDSWRLLRESPDDPGSKRFFTGYGRFGEVAESELELNTTTRELTIVGGSRKESAKDHHLWVIKGYIREHPESSMSGVVKAFSKDQQEYEPIGQRTVEDAIRYGMKKGELHPGYSPNGKAMKLTVTDPKASTFDPFGTHP
jgi:hypothetical protein